MPTLGILKLPETTTVVNNNLFLVQQNNVTKQIPFGNLKFGSGNVTFSDTISSNGNSLNYLTTTLNTLSTSFFGLSGGIQNFIYNSLYKTFLNLSLLLYPVGSVKYTTNFVNPGTLIPNTKWSLISEGLYLGGVGNTINNGGLYISGDKNGVNNTFTVGNNSNLGEYSHLLIAAELPSHTHTIAIRLNLTGSTTSYQNGDQAVPGMRIDTSTTYTTNNGNGGGLSHNNMPPLYGVYVWQRTA